MSSVESLLQQQHDQLTALLLSLEKELELISTRQPEQLIELVEQKSVLLDAIQLTDTAIDNGIKARDNDELSGSERALMESVTENVKKCKRLTAINEKAVEQSQLKLAHLRQLIMDVRVRESLTYDKSGKTKGGTLGKGIKA